jgi:peroxiredoxin
MASGHKGRSLLILCLVVAAAGAWYLVRRQSPHGGQSGNYPPAPQFSLTDLSGRKLDSASFRGRVVLIDFWATWCEPCQAEIPHFVEFQKRYQQRGFQVVGISMDDTAGPVRDFCRKFGVNYPVAVGDEKTAAAFGGVLGLPVAFLIGPDGRIAAKYTGLVDMGVLQKDIEQLLRQ